MGGIALQVASYLKFGEQPGRSEDTIAEPRSTEGRLVLTAVAVIMLLTVASIGYYAASIPQTSSSGAPQGVVSVSKSQGNQGCASKTTDGTIFVGAILNVRIMICGQSFLLESGPGGGLDFGYPAGPISFVAPGVVNGSHFDYWYVLLRGSAPMRVTNLTLVLNLPAGLAAQSSVIEALYTVPISLKSSASGPGDRQNEIQGSVSCWKLADGSGTSAADSCGANTGTLIGAPKWIDPSFCIMRGCLQLVGPTQGVLLNPNHHLPNSSITVGVWARVTNHTTEDVFVQDSWARSPGSWIIYGDASNWNFGIRDGSGATHVVYAAHSNDTKWNYLVATWTGTVMTLYVNGTQIASVGASNTTLLQSMLQIGTSNSGSVLYENDLRLWPTALSAAQVLQQYLSYFSEQTIMSSQTTASVSSSTLTMVNGSLVGRWTFTEARGTVAHDSTGNGADGQLVNSPAWIRGTDCGLPSCLVFGQNNQSVSFPYRNYGNTVSTSIWFYLISPQNLTLNIWQIMNMDLSLASNGNGLRYYSDTSQPSVFCPYTMPLSQWLNIQTSQARTSYSISVNGSAVCSGTISSINTGDSGSEGLGTRDSGSPKSIVSDFSVYASILSSSQASKIYLERSSSQTSISTTSSSATLQGCMGSDGSILILTNLNDAVSVNACEVPVAVPGGAGGGLVYGYAAGFVTFVAPPTADGLTFQYWQVSIPSLHVKVTTNDLRLNLPAGYLWNNAQIEAFYG